MKGAWAWISGILSPAMFASFVGLVFLAVLMWFLGPLIPGLGAETTRFIIMGVMIVAYAVINGVLVARKSGKQKEMVAGVAGAAGVKLPGGAGGDTSEEIATLRKRLEEALEHLKKLHGGKRRGKKKYLYELPWYILIGPPGSGKTTALTNSGLQFPLAERFGKSIKGAAGTRNCDWFLTDEAVLVDTAGRYTTQDSDEKADQTAWFGFLDLLKKFRPRQPINGAIIAISLSDLITLPEAERQAHAEAVRKRLAELQERFRVRFPVYVLFTKADLIAGFVETFETMSREEREQVWGMTFPLDAGGDTDPVVHNFPDELRQLLGRLDERMIERMQQEADLLRRGLLFAFPAQIASLADTAREFLDGVFVSSRFEQRPLLRGLYFTSGTQEGTPIDRMLGAIAQRFGLDRQRLPSFSGAGRSYFLTRLFREVIFAEASLVSRDARVEKRQRILRWASYATGIIIMVGACSAWAVSYFGNKALEDQVRAGITDVKVEAAKLDAPVLQDADPARTLVVLDKLRKLPVGFETANAAVPISMTFGLYQGYKLGSQEIAAYRRGLNLFLLPRLLSRLQTQLRANITKPDYLYEGLKIYLMLGLQHQIDRAAVSEWMTLDWEAAYPGAAQTETRAALRRHLDALLDEPLTEYPLDGPLVEDTRRALRQFPLAGRAYLLLKERAAAAKLPTWQIGEHAGPAADRVLSPDRLSGNIPGLYTKDGFYFFFLPGVADSVKSVEADAWVLGGAAAAAARPEAVEQDVLQLYYDDYARYWEGLISDITIQPLRNTAQAAELLNIISSSTSPLKTIWVSIDQETQLAHPPEGAAKTGGAAAPPAAGEKAAAATPTPSQSRIAALLAPSAAAQQPAYGRPVEERFRPFHEFVAGTGGTSPMDDMMHDMSDLYTQFNRLAAAPPGGGGPPAGGPEAAAAARKLEASAARLPPAAGAVAKAVAKGAAGISAGGARSQLSADYEQRILPLCTKALDGRYPMIKASGTDVAPDDFSRLFSPGGLLDSFFSTSLRPYVDTTKNPWRAPEAGLGGVSVSNDAVAQFQRASRIRDTYFSTGATPSAKFEITPIRIDSGTTKVIFEVEGQEISFDGKNSKPVVVQWPGPTGVHQSRIAFEPADPAPSSVVKTGSWSFFRLLDAGKLQSLGTPDRWQVTFTAGTHEAVFEIHAGSVANPLASRDLSEFRCPKTL